jgi:hypothetical protein
MFHIYRFTRSKPVEKILAKMTFLSSAHFQINNLIFSHEGTKARRHKGTKAQRHKGAKNGFRFIVFVFLLKKDERKRNIRGYGNRKHRGH